LGGFDETLLAGEDADLAWRMRLAGLHVSHEERAVVFYRTRLTAGGLFHQRYAYGMAHVRLFARYKERGMPRSSTVGAIKSWVKLIVTSYQLASADSRRDWLWAAGWRLGRAVGSVEERQVYL
jgi:GT2 family glycosyltransferase